MAGHSVHGAQGSLGEVDGVHKHHIIVVVVVLILLLQLLQNRNHEQKRKSQTAAALQNVGDQCCFIRVLYLSVTI